MTSTALVPYVKPRDESPAAIHVRTLWSGIKDFIAGLPPDRRLTAKEAVGLQRLRREYAAATRLKLVGAT